MVWSMIRWSARPRSAIRMRPTASRQTARFRLPSHNWRRYHADAHGGELAVHRLPEHHVFHDLLLADAERARLLGNLLLHQRCSHEAGADDVGADAVLTAFLGDGKPAISTEGFGRLARALFVACGRVRADDSDTNLFWGHCPTFEEGPPRQRIAPAGKERTARASDVAAQEKRIAGDTPRNGSQHPRCRYRASLRRFGNHRPSCNDPSRL